PQKYIDKFSILHNNFIGGQVFENIHGKDQTTFWIMGAFIVVLLLKNTNSILSEFKPNWYYSILFLIFSLTGILNLILISEFLYFNF
ncbi:MAG: MBOAT family protein, partial [Pseudomonadota bacterium]